MSSEITYGRSPEEIKDDLRLLLVEEFGQDLDELLDMGWDALRNRHWRLEQDRIKKEDRDFYRGRYAAATRSYCGGGPATW